MARSIAVRIKTEKVIASLEASLEKMQHDKENEKPLREKYDKELEAWTQKVKKYALTMPKPKDMDMVAVGGGYYHRIASGNPEDIAVQIVLAVPANKVPERPEAPDAVAAWQYRDAVENIENALRLLRMTDQEEISTGTYSKIAQYL